MAEKEVHLEVNVDLGITVTLATGNVFAGTRTYVYPDTFPTVLHNALRVYANFFSPTSLAVSRENNNGTTRFSTFRAKKRRREFVEIARNVFTGTFLVFSRSTFDNRHRQETTARRKTVGHVLLEISSST